MTIQQAMDQAMAKHRAGNLADAEAVYRQVLRQDPDNADAMHMLGLVAAKCRKFDDATKLIGRAIELSPKRAEFHGNLGMVHAAAGNFDEAMKSYDDALKLRPDYAVVFSNMGAVFKTQGKLREAEKACRRAVELRPQFAEGHYNLANALGELAEHDEEIAEYRRAIELSPTINEAWNNLGNALKAVGEIDEAIAAARRALEIDPKHMSAHTNLIYALYSHPDTTPAQILQEQTKWDERFARPLANALPPPENSRDPDRRLKIGYISSDFREHVVGWNLLPILQEHDHQNFEVYCYSSLKVGDEMTEKCRKCADVWQKMATLNDAALAGKIREDGIDILIDLSLHTAGNRLLTFARKPAPVQISYLGYCGGAGLSAIGYRFTDHELDDAGTEGDYGEKALYLPSYWCYRPGAEAPEVAQRPMLSAGHVTFGCLNNFAKVSLPAQKLWAKILGEVENSHLLLHVPSAIYQEKARERFAGWGIAPDRLEFVGKKPLEEYLANYGKIDVALDPFPYNGGITTCDALWMGVPVVSLAGKTSVGRAGKSILGNIGHPEWVAHSEEEYLNIAVKLAKNPDELSAKSAKLRQEMSGSPLMNAKEAAAAMESRYREVWRNWCKRA